MSCKNNTNKYSLQNFEQGKKKYQSIEELPQQMINLSKNKIEKKVKGGEVYTYVVASVSCKNGKLLQYGCGPNLEGGRITLCTCKHKLRACHTIKDWKGKWVAGFTGINTVKNEKKNYLFYLMKIDKAYDSHAELWKALNKECQTKKSTNRNSLGDVYEPISKKLEGEARFDSCNYKDSCKGHPHHKKMQKDKDVDHATLLVGDQSNSFIWETPLIFLKDNKFPNHGLGRRSTAKSYNFKDFIRRIKNA